MSALFSQYIQSLMFGEEYYLSQDRTGSAVVKDKSLNLSGFKK